MKRMMGWTLAAALAGTVRAPGIVVAGAVGLAALVAIVRYREWRSLIGAAIAPLGFLGTVLGIGLHAGRLDAWHATEHGGGPRLARRQQLLARQEDRPHHPGRVGAQPYVGAAHPGRVAGRGLGAHRAMPGRARDSWRQASQARVDSAPWFWLTPAGSNPSTDRVRSVVASAML